jgi:hypothetical protein
MQMLPGGICRNSPLGVLAIILYHTTRDRHRALWIASFTHLRSTLQNIFKSCLTKIRKLTKCWKLGGIEEDRSVNELREKILNL